MEGGREGCRGVWRDIGRKRERERERGRGREREGVGEGEGERGKEKCTNFWSTRNHNLPMRAKKTITNRSRRITSAICFRL